MWQPPPFTSGVAWKVRLEPSPSQSDADLSRVYPPTEYVGPASTGTGAISLGRIVFPTRSAQYCATLVITDLRTGQEKLAEICAPQQQATQGTDSDTRLGACAQSPSPTLTEAWCRLAPGSAVIPECTGMASGTAGSGGTGGSAGGTGGYTGFGGLVSDYFPAGASGRAGPQSSGTGGSGSVTPAPGNEAEAEGGPRTSKGCQLGGSSSSSGGWLGASLVLALLARRRRSVGSSLPLG
jgi:MYXO-CTERM domain-containing protein